MTEWLSFFSSSFVCELCSPLTLQPKRFEIVPVFRWLPLSWLSSCILSVLRQFEGQGRLSKQSTKRGLNATLQREPSSQVLLPQRLYPKWHPISYIVHNFWPGPWAIGNRVHLGHALTVESRHLLLSANTCSHALWPCIHSWCTDVECIWHNSCDITEYFCTTIITQVLRRNCTMVFLKLCWQTFTTEMLYHKMSLYQMCCTSLYNLSV